MRHHCSVALAQDAGDGRIDFPISYCAGCHGASGQDFAGEKVGKVTAFEDINTDRRRLDSYTYTLAVNQSTLYAGYPHRFQHFRKTFGYANMPLDGLWLRAPYLHTVRCQRCATCSSLRPSGPKCSIADMTSTIKESRVRIDHC